MLSENQIKKFQEYYEARFNLKISRDEAYEQATKLISIVKLIYKPILKQDYDDLQIRREKDSEVNNKLIEESNGKSIPP